MTAITVDGPTLTVEFDEFGLDSYGLFLKAKTLPESQITYDWERDTYTLTAPARFAPLLGAQAPGEERQRLPLADHLFDYQRWVVERALDRKRMACWLDTGLGKTIVFTEWARQVMALTDGRVLIFTPLAVIPQVIEEAHRFYGDSLTIEHLDTREALADWCRGAGPAIGITNHHKMVDGQIPELRYLAGVVLDEASILKAGGGKIKWNLIHSCKGIEYKLSCTATPAPNEVMEYASQASWLEKLRDGGDILWTYFHKTKQGDWQVKPHARAAFYQFMASWSVYMRDPAKFGFADILASLPDPDIREYEVPMTDQQRELALGYRTVAGKGMFDDRLGVSERSKLSQLAKGFLYDSSGARRLTARVESCKPEFVADLVRADVADGRQVLVWTIFDEESVILQQLFTDAGDRFTVGVLDGDMTDAARLAVLDRFRRGDLQVLISKASLIGYGVNLQFVRSEVFSGFDDSFERMYQAVRRCVRFGQTEVVRVHVPYVPELEGMVFNNVKGKEAAFLRDVALQEDEYRKVMMEAA